MVVPVDQDGKSVDATAFSEPSTSSEDPVSSRKGGIQDESTRSVEKVIVDMREFRSELPALLHKRGIEIEPVTLVVRIFFKRTTILNFAPEWGGKRLC